MTYITGQPILFVGCGQVRRTRLFGLQSLILSFQTYTDLRHLKVNHIVQALLSE